MTKYEYAGEMQELCFRISQAYKVLGDTGLYDFYYATSKGFAEIRNSYSVKEAQQTVNHEQIEQLENTTAFAKDVRKQAAYKLDKEIAI